MRTDAGVSCNAMDTILANMRLKFGRNFVEPGQEEASSLHNSQYRQFFTGKQAEFHDKDEKPIAKPFVYCSQYIPFLNMVAKNRGPSWRTRSCSSVEIMARVSSNWWWPYTVKVMSQE